MTVLYEKSLQIKLCKRVNPGCCGFKFIISCTISLLKLFRTCFDNNDKTYTVLNHKAALQ